jgi:anti-sigma regulatory factor (Ser/Thr protein kinase)
VFDMKNVCFIEPCGAIALLSAARHCASLSGRRVILININEQVYRYLDRMNLFTIANHWLTPLKCISSRWGRSPSTTNLLELTTISGPNDVAEVIERASGIFAPCLTSDELGDLLSVLSELCSNIFEHSNDPYGCVLIQKYHYEQKQRDCVCLSVGDMGRGVQASLTETHGVFGTSPLDYIQAAMNGRSSRKSGRGGLGLLNVKRILATHGGYICMRSETAAVTDSDGTQVQGRSNMAYMSGTQVSVTLRSEFPS